MDQPDRRIRPYTLKAGEGWTYRFGVDFTVKAGEVRDGSGAAFVEYVTRRGEEPPSHIHETEDEMFYVLEGAVTFQCGGVTFDLEKGGFVFLPRGIEHSYTIRSQEPVRLIAVTSPARERPGGGWGGFVADMELGQGELLATPPASPVCQIETSPDKRQSFR
jgi:quercetin dioxygenase-like cupin family protein